VSHNVEHILQLEVPIIVRLGEKKLPLRDVMLLVPGTILELPKAAESDLEMLVNNKVVGQGVAVKVGENFGLRITKIGDARARVMALGESPAASAGPSAGADAPSEDDDFAALAAAMLAGQ
jgi:flagellar motor switch protein FliN/FliY